MKILHINYSDNHGGAAKAALRLVLAQRKFDLDAKMLVVKKNTNYSFVGSISKARLLKIRLSSIFLQIILFVLNKSSNSILHSFNIFSSGLHKIINSSDADIVHLHWINGEMLSISEIAKITKPIVWTLHDSWPFCGAEHHPNGIDDNAYVFGYKPNPYGGVNINNFVFCNKLKSWANCAFKIVAPSVWEKNCAEKSLILESKPIYVIPNCLDLDVFRPFDKVVARKLLNLSIDKKYILFGAVYPSQFIKGGDLLHNVLTNYLGNDLENVILLFFGSLLDDSLLKLNLPVQYLGKIYDETKMATIYNAADVTLVPSRIESFGQVASESLACGTPVVCFDVGGLVDIVDHKINGYVAKHFDIIDLAQGIKWCLSNANYKELSLNAREKVVQNYDEKIVVKQYLDIYSKLII